MAFYYKITFERKNENGEIEQNFCYFLHSHQTHWIYEENSVWEKTTVEYCRAECRHEAEYVMAWKNSCKWDAPQAENDNDNDSDDKDSDEELTPNQGFESLAIAVENENET